MKAHLAKHNIFEKSDPDGPGEGSSKTKQLSIASIQYSSPEPSFPWMSGQARTIKPFWELSATGCPLTFKYQERVLEFSELAGSHSGENMAETLQKMLVELRIEEKLLTITADNASNNETLAFELYFNLWDECNSEDSKVPGKGHLRFQGIDSYIRCLAHVLNLIVRGILSG
ncbi:hypothetical protein N7449_005056 [Penicillium cf. viridicatum]|uniref:AC transposase n=1 Tax=Penicillium cf. viridicatum TaxID=2972119 RepID=A0A9W9MKI4_9EURO|nr:hypothetical protein N7449_005056 [Penicillium cf. viridicatum]